MDDDVDFDDRVTRALGIRIPILEAPIGFVANVLGSLAGRHLGAYSGLFR
jgi:hypothetical protein